MNRYRKGFIDTMEYYSAMRKMAHLLFDTPLIGLKGIMLSEICQREKDKYFLTSLICGNLKKKKKNSDRKKRLVVARGGGGQQMK